MVFLNRSFDKKRLKALLLWFRLNLSEGAALEAVEILQELGFRSATQGAISLGLDDLKTPTSKNGRVFQAQLEVALAHHEHHRGNRTPVELFQHLVDTWHRTSQDLTTEVVQLFRSTERVNPVYMMAFSGARGNLSQVRQLVGMRGLMADPRGQIVGFPILSNFREGLTITEYFVSCYGARKGVVDTAIRTADAGYLTRRLADVSHHFVVRTTNCGTHRTICLRDIKEGQKTILPLASRLVGRVLGEHIPQIAFRNQEITPDLASKLASQCTSLQVRSPLSCSLRWGVCQLCYGWGLSEGRRVTLGEAVGIIAAQSIGEPGTQLTLRTFHTGGVFSGDLLNEIRAPYNGTVFFPSPLQGLLVRTPHGQIAFLTKVSGKMIFSFCRLPSNLLAQCTSDVSLPEVHRSDCVPRRGKKEVKNGVLAKQEKSEVHVQDVNTKEGASPRLLKVNDADKMFASNADAMHARPTETGASAKLFSDQVQKENKEFSLQPSTVIFVRQKEQVTANQLLAEFSSSTLQPISDQIEVTQQVLSESAGQVWFKEIEYGNRKGPGSGSLGTHFSSQKLGGVWVLAGKPRSEIILNDRQHFPVNSTNLANFRSDLLPSMLSNLATPITQNHLQQNSSDLTPFFTSSYNIKNVTQSLPSLHLPVRADEIMHDTPSCNIKDINGGCKAPLHQRFGISDAEHSGVHNVYHDYHFLKYHYSLGYVQLLTFLFAEKREITFLSLNSLDSNSVNSVCNRPLRECLKDGSHKKGVNQQSTKMSIVAFSNASSHPCHVKQKIEGGWRPRGKSRLPHSGAQSFFTSDFTPFFTSSYNIKDVTQSLQCTFFAPTGHPQTFHSLCTCTSISDASARASCIVHSESDKSLQSYYYTPLSSDNNAPTVVIGSASWKARNGIHSLHNARCTFGSETSVASKMHVQRCTNTKESSETSEVTAGSAPKVQRQMHNQSKALWESSFANTVYGWKTYKYCYHPTSAIFITSGLCNFDRRSFCASVCIKDAKKMQNLFLNKWQKKGVAHASLFSLLIDSQRRATRISKSTVISNEIDATLGSCISSAPPTVSNQSFQTNAIKHSGFLQTKESTVIGPEKKAGQASGEISLAWCLQKERTAAPGMLLAEPFFSSKEYSEGQVFWLSSSFIQQKRPTFTCNRIHSVNTKEGTSTMYKAHAPKVQVQGCKGEEADYIYDVTNTSLTGLYKKDPIIVEKMCTESLPSEETSFVSLEYISSAPKVMPLREGEERADSMFTTRADSMSATRACASNSAASGFEKRNVVHQRCNPVIKKLIKTLNLTRRQSSATNRGIFSPLKQNSTFGSFTALLNYAHFINGTKFLQINDTDSNSLVAQCTCGSETSEVHELAKHRLPSANDSELDSYTSLTFNLFWQPLSLANYPNKIVCPIENWKEACESNSIAPTRFTNRSLHQRYNKGVENVPVGKSELRFGTNFNKIAQRRDQKSGVFVQKPIWLSIHISNNTFFAPPVHINFFSSNIKETQKKSRQIENKLEIIGKRKRVEKNDSSLDQHIVHTVNLPIVDFPYLIPLADPDAALRTPVNINSKRVWVRVSSQLLKCKEGAYDYNSCNCIRAPLHLCTSDVSLPKVHSASCIVQEVNSKESASSELDSLNLQLCISSALQKSIRWTPPLRYILSVPPKKPFNFRASSLGAPKVQRRCTQPLGKPIAVGCIETTNLRFANANPIKLGSTEVHLRRFTTGNVQSCIVQKISPSKGVTNLSKKQVKSAGRTYYHSKCGTPIQGELLPLIRQSFWEENFFDKSFPLDSAVSYTKDSGYICIGDRDRLYIKDVKEWIKNVARQKLPFSTRAPLHLRRFTTEGASCIVQGVNSTGNIFKEKYLRISDIQFAVSLPLKIISNFQGRYTSAHLTLPEKNLVSFAPLTNKSKRHNSLCVHTSSQQSWPGFKAQRYTQAKQTPQVRVQSFATSKLQRSCKAKFLGLRLSTPKFAQTEDFAFLGHAPIGTNKSTGNLVYTAGVSPMFAHAPLGSEFAPSVSTTPGSASLGNPQAVGSDCVTSLMLKKEVKNGVLAKQEKSEVVHRRYKEDSAPKVVIAIACPEGAKKMHFEGAKKMHSRRQMHVHGISQTCCYRLMQRIVEYPAERSIFHRWVTTRRRKLQYSSFSTSLINIFSALNSLNECHLFTKAMESNSLCELKTSSALTSKQQVDLLAFSRAKKMLFDSKRDDNNALPIRNKVWIVEKKFTSFDGATFLDWYAFPLRSWKAPLIFKDASDMVNMNAIGLPLHLRRFTTFGCISSAPKVHRALCIVNDADSMPNVADQFSANVKRDCGSSSTQLLQKSTRFSDILINIGDAHICFYPCNCIRAPLHRRCIVQGVNSKEAAKNKQKRTGSVMFDGVLGVVPSEKEKNISIPLIKVVESNRTTTLPFSDQIPLKKRRSVEVPFLSESDQITFITNDEILLSNYQKHTTRISIWQNRNATFGRFPWVVPLPLHDAPWVHKSFVHPRCKDATPSLPLRGTQSHFLRPFGAAWRSEFKKGNLDSPIALGIYTRAPLHRRCIVQGVGFSIESALSEKEFNFFTTSSSWKTKTKITNAKVYQTIQSFFLPIKVAFSVRAEKMHTIDQGNKKENVVHASSFNIKNVTQAKNCRLETTVTPTYTYLYPGQLVTYGEKMDQKVATTESGQVLYLDSQRATLRKAQTVLIYSQAILSVLSGEWIKKSTPLMALSYQKLVTGDIVQGLPKIEQFFEAPLLKDGTFWSDSLQAKLNLFFQEHRGKFPLAEAVRKGFSDIQRVLVEGVQRVYISQGVLIADKHLEVIVRQMTCKGRILYSGDTGFLRNELVALDKIESVNQVTYGQKALYHPQVRGITDASLESESFLSAASFQETTRVLSRDAVIGKTDLMRGLKERVIVGELIQAGTGLTNNSVYSFLLD